MSRITEEVKRGGLKKPSGINGCLISPNRVNSNYLGMNSKLAESMIKKKVRIVEDESPKP